MAEMHLKDADGILEQPDQGLHCLLIPTCPNT